jgi:regulator of ribosome biosynthesis
MPTAKPLTRWEKFAKIKGIKKKKKSKIAWDETEQTWKRTHGYDKANDDSNQWLVEVKSSDPAPHEDPWKVC